MAVRPAFQSGRRRAIRDGPCMALGITLAEQGDKPRAESVFRNALKFSDTPAAAAKKLQALGKEQATPRPWSSAACQDR